MIGLYLVGNQYLRRENNITDNKREFELEKNQRYLGVWTDISFCLDFKNKRMDAWINGEKKVEVARCTNKFPSLMQYISNTESYRSFVSRYKNQHGSIPHK